MAAFPPTFLPCVRRLRPNATLTGIWTEDHEILILKHSRRAVPLQIFKRAEKLAERQPWQFAESVGPRCSERKVVLYFLYCTPTPPHAIHWKVLKSVVKGLFYRAMMKSRSWLAFLLKKSLKVRQSNFTGFRGTSVFFCRLTSSILPSPTELVNCSGPENVCALLCLQFQVSRIRQTAFGLDKLPSFSSCKALPLTKTWLCCCLKTTICTVSMIADTATHM